MQSKIRIKFGQIYSFGSKIRIKLGQIYKFLRALSRVYNTDKFITCIFPTEDVVFFDRPTLPFRQITSK